MNEKFYDIHNIKMTLSDYVTLSFCGLLVVGTVVLVKAIKEEKKEKIKREKAFWNDGICLQCGEKWHYRHYYPAGSKGAYQHVEIKCHKCKTKATLEETEIPEKYSNIYL